MVSWEVLCAENPDIAQRGEALLFQFGIGLAFFATLRKDGAPRLHPISPVISQGRLYALIGTTTPKYHDLRRDGRYALQAFPPPGDDATGEFYLTGRAVYVEDPALAGRVLHDAKHPPAADEVVFELLLDRAMYTHWERGEGGKMRKISRKWRAAA